MALACSGAAVADSCPGGCPTVATNGNVTVAPGTVNNNVEGNAAPSASNQNLNEQFNYSNQGQYTRSNTGCSEQRTTIMPNAGVGGINGLGYNYSTWQVGISAVIPIGGHKEDCDAFFKTTLAMHANDEKFGNANACLGLVDKARALHIEPNAYLVSAGLGGICPVVAAIVVVVPVVPTPVAVVPLPIATPAPLVAHLSDFSPRCDASQLANDKKAIRAERHRYQAALKTFHPDHKMSKLEARALKDCATIEMVDSWKDG